MTRNLIQFSERKKDRLKYADPLDHSFNYESKFVDRPAFTEYQRQAGNLGVRPVYNYVQHRVLPKVNKIDVEEEDELITVLKDILQHEKELEDAKICLAQCPDFNLMDGFQMIDLNSKGWVTAPQLQESLQQHGLFSHKDDIYTFVRRYDQDSDGRFVYSDFCDAFTPRDHYFANLLGFRNAEYIHRMELKLNYFTPETREMFMRCFRVHFEIEESVELIKQRLTRRPKFSARNSFDTLDLDGHGFITLEGLKRIFH